MPAPTSNHDYWTCGDLPASGSTKHLCHGPPPAIPYRKKTIGTSSVHFRGSVRCLDQLNILCIDNARAARAHALPRFHPQRAKNSLRAQNARTVLSHPLLCAATSCAFINDAGRLRHLPQHLLPTAAVVPTFGHTRRRRYLTRGPGGRDVWITAFPVT